MHCSYVKAEVTPPRPGQFRQRNTRRFVPVLAVRDSSKRDRRRFRSMHTLAALFNGLTHSGTPQFALITAQDAYLSRRPDVGFHARALPGVRVEYCIYHQ
jgi:hypothetical protein